MNPEGHNGLADIRVRTVRFESFELDVRAGELRKRGLRIRLQEQPLQILLMLLRSPGEVVLREEIRKRLWPHGTIVEFAHSINAAIQRLRDTLGDSADHPRYVETVARRGYRFIGTVEAERDDHPDRLSEPPVGNGPVPRAPDTSDLDGETIIHYRIVKRLGSGSMGVVYQAEDLKLGRQVALKFLPYPVASEPPRVRERFEREARLATALNHPNICTIHGVEEFAGQPVIVMELLDGETLKARLARGPLPLESIFGLAAQLAVAVDAAHRKGIVHRDLKPANIMITKSGIKVLDFGIARMENLPGEALTEWHGDMGALAYMAPEQREGKEADARTDIYSLGLVVYEMVTGERAFESAELRTLQPLSLERAVKTCLAKDPEERWQSTRDLKRELDWIGGAPGKLTILPTSVTRLRGLPWIAAGIAIVVAAGLGIVASRATTPAELKPLVRLDVDLGPDVSPSSDGEATILSPDGTRLVYTSRRRLFTRKLDQPKATELAGTEGAHSLFFSPDGRWVAFFAGYKLKKIPVEGGAPVVLCNAPDSVGASWGDDGNIIATLSSPGALSRIPSTGGTPTPVTELAQGETDHGWPHVLPGSKAVLFTSSTSPTGLDGGNIEVVSLKDRRRKTLLRGGSLGRYLLSGHLVYMNHGTLFAVPFDLNTLDVRGTPVPVLDHVAHDQRVGSSQLDFSQTGMVVYRSGGEAGTERVTVQWLDRQGKTQPLVAKPGAYAFPRLSPDGQRLALQIREGPNRDIWIYDLHRDTMMRLTFDAGAEVGMNPVWTPDGRDIVFQGKAGIFWTRSDGSGKPRLLTRDKSGQFPYSFTPDGRRLAWYEWTANGHFAVWTMHLENDAAGLRVGKPEAFLQNPFHERNPAFSPDGHLLAYTSPVSGTDQVCVRTFPDGGGKWQISDGGGSLPVWSRNGRELFFRSPDNRIMVVAYTVQGDSIVADKPRVWSEKRVAGVFDLAPDGKRVVALMPIEPPEAQQDQNHVIFLMNFFDELRRKAPIHGR